MTEATSRQEALNAMVAARDAILVHGPTEQTQAAYDDATSTYWGIVAVDRLQAALDAAAAKEASR